MNRFAFTHSALYFSCFVLAIAALSSGCNDDDPAMADSGRDAATDAGADTSTGDTSMPDDAEPDADMGLVADCEAALDTAAAFCDGDDSPERACYYRTYKTVCTTGNPATIIAALGCFESDDCRAFGDPGTTMNAECLATVHEDMATTASAATHAAYCAKCPGDELCSGDGAFAVPFSHLSDEANATLRTCYDAAPDCSDSRISDCLVTQFPDLAVCFM